MNKKEIEFWATNISNKNVCMRDLALTIPANSSVNLLSKYYLFTLEQLELSAVSGSLYNKRDKILIRQTKPEEPIKSGIMVSKMPRFVAQNMVRTKIIVEDIKYEELNLSEEEFANDMTDD